MCGPEPTALHFGDSRPAIFRLPSKTVARETPIYSFTGGGGGERETEREGGERERALDQPTVDQRSKCVMCLQKCKDAQFGFVDTTF
jgi:hypothetical protein